MVRHQMLVGGDDVFPGLHRCRNVFKGGAQSAQDLHHGVHLRVGQDHAYVPHGHSAQLRPVPADQHVFDLHARHALYDVDHAASHGAAAQQTDFHTATSFPYVSIL